MSRSLSLSLVFLTSRSVRVLLFSLCLCLILIHVVLKVDVMIQSWSSSKLTTSQILIDESFISLIDYIGCFIARASCVIFY